jgi:hypothetical protein
MNLLIPPTREEMKQNFRLLVADWRSGNTLMRYFVVSLFLASAVSTGASLASFVALAANQPGTALALVCVAGACLLHAVGTNGVLKRRYQVRFAIW